MKIKFNLIDYIIIILIIIAIIFAFIHITSDDSSDLQKTAFDESTFNKIPDTYMKYYKDGFKVNATVEGFNASNGEKTSISGDIVWLDCDSGSDIKILIESGNKTYLTGPYRYVRNADIYIDHISLESNGEKYQNLTEITVNPKKITSLNDLIAGIGNDTDFEISTVVSLDLVNAKDMQEISNKLQHNSKRVSVKTATSDMDNQIVISKATKDNINDASSVLGNIDGVTNEITIRVYNSNDDIIDFIKNHEDILNIRKF